MCMELHGAWVFAPVFELTLYPSARPGQVARPGP